MNRYPVVEIVWQDAHGGDEGWLPVGKLPGKPATVRTVGMLARESETSVVVILSLDRRSMSYGGYVLIPKQAITERRELA